ncbi:MAG: DUF2283 domain-containing protein [Candidatus Binatia bacterium]
MKITYDSKYDIVYMKFVEDSPKVVTKQINDDVSMDFGEKDRIVGLEILSASRYLDLSLLLPVRLATSPEK